MSVTRVQRRLLHPLFLSASQNVSGTLSFLGPTVVELDPSAFVRSGEYVIFTYGAFNNSDITNLLVDDYELKQKNRLGVISGPTNDSGLKRISIVVDRKILTSTVSYDGAAYLDENITVTFPSSGSTTMYLSDSIYSLTQDYVLFDYSAPGSSVVNWSSGLAVDASSLRLSRFGSVYNDPMNRRIVLSLLSKPDNGTQYVEGDLNFEGSMSVVLSPQLYATPGEYVLFDVSGSVKQSGTALNDGESVTFIEASSPKGFTVSTPIVVMKPGGGFTVELTLS